MDYKDKDFINGVKKKINYLEYARIEAEKIQNYKKANIKKKIKIILSFIIVVFLMLIPIIITKSFNIAIAFVLGLCILGFCCYYENYLKEICE